MAVIKCVYEWWVHNCGSNFIEIIKWRKIK